MVPKPSRRIEILREQGKGMGDSLIIAFLLVCALAKIGIRQEIGKRKVFIEKIEKAERDLCLIGKKVEKYRGEHRVYPLSLDDLGGYAEVDPFSGSEYRYMKVPNGWLISSIGPDHRDNRAEKAYARSNGLRSQGDIVLSKDGHVGTAPFTVKCGKILGGILDEVGEK